jgi:hypothetical protein
MGFSYSHLGLDCDFCSNSGPQQNVRKIACPYGYCQHWACCNICFKAKKHLMSSCANGTHKDTCKFLAIEFDKRQKEKELTN